MKRILVDIDSGNIDSIRSLCNTIEEDYSVKVKGLYPFKCEHPLTGKKINTIEITIEGATNDSALKELVSQLSNESDYVAVVELRDL